MHISINSDIIENLDLFYFIEKEEIEQLKEMHKEFNKLFERKLDKLYEQLRTMILNIFIKTTDSPLLENLLLVIDQNTFNYKLSEYNLNFIIFDKLKILSNRYSINIISLEEINNEIDILLKNPSYIFNNYLSKNTINKSSLFIKLNIHIINKNLKINLNLLKFFLAKYVENKLINNKKNIIICLIHIQLLLVNCHSDVDLKELEDINELFIYNYYQIKVPEINLEMLDQILFSIYKTTSNIDKDKDIFIETIIENKSNITSIRIFTEFLLTKHNIILDSQYNNISITINLFIKKLLNIK